MDDRLFGDLFCIVEEKSGWSKNESDDSNVKFSFVEVYQLQQSNGQYTTPIFQEGMLEYDKVESWLGQPGVPDSDFSDTAHIQFRTRLRLLMAREPLDGTHMSSTMYSRIAAAFKLPNVSGSSYFSDAAATEFKPFEGGFGLHMMLDWNGLTLTYDQASETTYAMVLHRPFSNMSPIIRCLHQLCNTQPFCLAPMISWLRIMACYQRNSFKAIRICLDDVRLEVSCDFRSDKQYRKELQEIDLLHLNGSLQNINEHLASFQHANEMLLNLVGRFLIRKTRFVNDLLQKQVESIEQRSRIQLCQVRDELIRLESWRKGTQRRVDMYHQTASNLISSRDNVLSYSIAKASKQIAEASLRDAAAMKQLTEETKNIAVRTYLDSANMKIMALINLMTLPGTFTATFFSTGFFNFQPKDPTSLVSQWLWLYFIVTVGLCAALGMCWYFWHTHAQRKGRTLLDRCRGESEEFVVNEEIDAGERPKTVRPTVLRKSRNLR